MRKMAIVAALILAIVPLCDQALMSLSTHTGNAMTWSDAQDFCRTHHTDLVTINSEEENHELSKYAGWIGLHREDGNSPWKWSRGDKEASFTFWAYGEPDSNQHCALKTPNSDRWQNSHCHYEHHFICYDVMLVLVKENKTWEEALDHCRSLGGVDTSTFRNHSYDLVTLSSDFDHRFARSEAQEATTDEVWTGLRFLAGEWLWVSGEEVKYRNMPSCETDRFCGVLEKNGNSSIRNCNERRNFFCHKRLQTSGSM